MKSLFLLLFISTLFINCGGYLPSPPTNWSANPSEKHIWMPPDEGTLANRRENQEYLDNLTGEIERLFINQASLIQEESTMDEMTRKKDAEIRETDRKFSNEIRNQFERNKNMEKELVDIRAKLTSQKELLRKLSEVKPPVIFSTKEYNAAMKAFSQGKYALSLNIFNKILTQNPPNFLKDNIHFGMGSSFFRLKKYQKAKNHFQKIIDNFKMGDKRFISYVMLGIILNLEGNKSRALFLLDEALDNNPPEKIKPLLQGLIKNINDNPSYASN